MLAANNIATNTPFARFYNASGMGGYTLQSSELHWQTNSTYLFTEREISIGKTTDLTYIQSPAGTVAAIKTTGTQHDAMLLATDHLGSIIGVWNANGTLLEEHRYSAWGLRTSSTASPRLRRGFTGHEHLAQFGIIDMQARLYDPHLGRFLAPDPYVQAPENPMNYNRYAYCFNNPLKYTDPTGCLIEEEFREILDEMHRLLDEANRMDQQLCVSFDGFGGGASGFGSVGGQLYSYDNGVASLTDVGMPFYHMHEGATVHGRYNADGSWITTRVDLPSWWGTVPDAGGNSWNPTNVGGWNVNWADNWHGGGGGGIGDGGGSQGGGRSSNLTSGIAFARELQKHYINGSGSDYHITAERLYNIFNQALVNDAIQWNKMTLVDGDVYKIPVNLYKTDYYLAFGTATIFINLDLKGKIYPVGIFDIWDLDPKPWGERSYPAELITRYYNWRLRDGKPFKITYP